MRVPIDIRVNDISARNPTALADLHDDATGYFLSGPRWRDQFSDVSNSCVTKSPRSVVGLRNEGVIDFSDNTYGTSRIQKAYVPSGPTFFGKTPPQVTGKSWPQISSFGLAVVPDLLFVGPPNRSGEAANKNSSESGERGSDSIEKLSDIPDRNNRHMIGGTFFVLSVLIVLAIFCM